MRKAFFFFWPCNETLWAVNRKSAMIKKKTVYIAKWRPYSYSICIRYPVPIGKFWLIRLDFMIFVSSFTRSSVGGKIKNFQEIVGSNSNKLLFPFDWYSLFFFLFAPRDCIRRTTRDTWKEQHTSPASRGGLNRSNNTRGWKNREVTARAPPPPSRIPHTEHGGI